jgi:hypothetical protein
MSYYLKWNWIIGLIAGVALYLLSAKTTEAQDADGPEIKVDPAIIRFGAVSRLTWVAHGSAAFLSGVGEVPLSGSLQVSPKEMTTFTLIVDDHGTIRSRSAKLRLQGAKGGDSIGPDLDQFSGEVTGQENALGFVQFQDFVFKTLQNKFGFRPVRGDYLPGRPYDVLYTELKSKPELVQEKDTGVRFRRIAYAVIIYKPNDDAKPPRGFQVKSLIEYQLQGESKWHPEGRDSPLVGQQSAEVKEILEAPPIPSNG